MNEVKRDNETLREIKQFQLSIENLVCNYASIQLPLTHKSGDILGVVFEEKKVYLHVSVVPAFYLFLYLAAVTWTSSGTCDISLSRDFLPSFVTLTLITVCLFPQQSKFQTLKSIFFFSSPHPHTYSQLIPVYYLFNVYLLGNYWVPDVLPGTESIAVNSMVMVEETVKMPSRD